MKKYIWMMLFLAVAILAAGGIIVFQNRKYGQEEKTREYEEIVMVLPTYGYVPEDTERVLEKMNEISEERCGVRAQYIFTAASSMETACRLRLDAGEQIDLMPCMESHSMERYLGEERLAPLDELLDAYGAGIMELYPEQLWEVLKRKDRIYAVSSLNPIANEEGLLIREDALAAIRLEKEDLQKAFEKAQAGGSNPVKVLDEVLTPVLERLSSSDAVVEKTEPVKEKKLLNGNSELGGLFGECQVVDYEGFGNTLGCVLGNSGQVVNLYETEEYRQMLQLIRSWQEAGFLYRVDSQKAESPTMVYNSGKGLGFFSVVSEEKEREYTDGSGYETAGIPLVQTRITSEKIRLGNWVIPAASEHKEAAMKILNLMFTDEEYVKTWFYGIEGVHYEKLQDGTIRQTGSYSQNLTWMFGNKFLALGGKQNMEESLRQYETREYSGYFGFVYDGEAYETEIRELQKILEEYVPELEMGKTQDVDAALQELNQKLHRAGLEKVMEDKQRQLDNWLQQKKLQ